MLPAFSFSADQEPRWVEFTRACGRWLFIFFMKSNFRSFLFIALSVLAGAMNVACTSVQQQPSLGVALIGGTLIDGSGTPPIENSVVLLRGQRIEAVGTISSLPVPPGYKEISTAGATVLPGLWDLHVHLLYAGHSDIQYWHRTYTPRYLADIMPATALQLLMAGVTSARDLGAPPEDIFSLKDRIHRGQLPGPTLYAAGPQLTRQYPDWARFYRWSISNSTEASEKASLLLARGADTLKVVDASVLTVEEIKKIVEVAHRQGKKVATHGRTLDEIRRGLEGGVDEFEHIGTGYAKYPRDILDMLAARAAAGNPVAWTITVGLPLHANFLRTHPEIFDEADRYGTLPDEIVADVKKSLAAFQPQLPDDDLAGIKRKVSQLREAGVHLLIGTDGGLAGNFHSFAINQEMEAWVNILGFDPLTVIQFATSRSAAYMGMGGQAGRISQGLFADIIVVNGNPLQDIAALRDPRIVFKHGHQHK